MARLGQHATPAEIRQEAYRVGFGTVNSHMLTVVRNELWPDRVRHKGGTIGLCPADSTTQLAFDDSKDERPACPECANRNSIVRDVRQVERGTWRRLRCKNCGSEFCIESESTQRVHPRRAMARAAIDKMCATCRRMLPVGAFTKKDADLYRSSCSECLNKGRARHGFRQLLKRHGLTEDDYHRMLAQQEGVCAICRKPETVVKKHWRRWDGDRPSQPLSIDHCHTTGVVRGLLCNRCNLGIGNFDDDPLRLEAAAAYLRQHQERR